MNWTDECVDYLIGGGCINLVGLDGSGRSNSLRTIAETLALEPSDWTCHIWGPSEFASMQRREVTSEIDSLQHSGGIPVLLIDDFGEILMTKDGLWLERLLFSRVFEASVDNGPSLRCVVVTHPRDREIVGPGSGLRERARHIYPTQVTPTRQQIAGFGCGNAEELLLLTGNNHHLLNVNGNSPSAQRGIARSTAQKWLPKWIGQLDTGHQNRLGAILSRAQPPRWLPEDADPLLSPIVVPRRSEAPVRCAIPECVKVEDLKDLLVGLPWPNHDLRAAARRFCARCGNDPNPLWVDSYLSDVDQLDFGRLLEFIEMVLCELPNAECIRLLSRNWVAGSRVHTSEILAALQQAGMSPELESRIQWRLYDQRNGANLHRRELILSSRRASFSLPPARIVIGQDPASNETDAAVAFPSCATAIAAWKSGTKVDYWVRGA